MDEIILSEEVIEALTSLILINERYSHKYYCNAKKIHQHYLLDLKPILEPYKDKSASILGEMEKREAIYKQQLNCRNNLINILD